MVEIGWSMIPTTYASDRFSVLGQPQPGSARIGPLPLRSGNCVKTCIGQYRLVMLHLDQPELDQNSEVILNLGRAFQSPISDIPQYPAQVYRAGAICPRGMNVWFDDSPQQGRLWRSIIRRRRRSRSARRGVDRCAGRSGQMGGIAPFERCKSFGRCNEFSAGRFDIGRTVDFCARHFAGGKNR